MGFRVDQGAGRILLCSRLLANIKLGELRKPDPWEDPKSARLKHLLDVVRITNLGIYF